MVSYPKFVRDRIPGLMRRQGGEPRIRRLSDDEFTEALAHKLVEEAMEFLATRNVEELADVLEVIRAVALDLGASIDDVERRRQAKLAERGAFEKRLLLESEPETHGRRSDQRQSYRDPVKAWTDPEIWAERLTSDGCPFCPMEPWSAHVELPASWVLIPDEAGLPGYVLVVSKRHVIEPYELPLDESAQFWADAMRAAAAVASVVQPVKVNYEIHGNTIPHLHLHIFPRFRGDPFERSQIDPHAVAPTRRSAAEIEDLRRAIAEADTASPHGS
jgi:predicted house-cleaning noncanonical NTP pyrophosphatase (MazG superfamily)/diadenosine tetraphosphate (Ap4A) HIT family hydrolase